MKKLLNGILDFRKNVLPHRREVFSRIAAGQTPDVLFITCSDSRVAPNWFASTDPGDLFVVRNVGNLVPPSGQTDSDDSVGAAIEFALLNLKISDIVVCGHSGCGAMLALSKGVESLPTSNLRQWLRYAEPSLKQNSRVLLFDSHLGYEDRLSQYNVLQQMDHLKTYPLIQTRIQSMELRVHGWWFEIAKGNVHAYEEKSKKFVQLDEKVAAPLLAEKKGVNT